jgi:hypothetical protein
VGIEDMRALRAKHLPAPIDPIETTKFRQETRNVLKQLVKAAQEWKRDRERIRSLYTFSGDREGQISAKISRPAAGDRTEVELYFWHRDRVLHIEQRQQLAEQRLRDCPFEDLPKVMESLKRFEDQILKHVEMMEKILATSSKEISSQENLLAKLASDGAKIAQAAMEHRDKMELASKAAQIPTTAQLKERLAAKYGCTVEQVDAILAAKQVEQEPDGSDEQAP